MQLPQEWRLSIGPVPVKLLSRKGMFETDEAAAQEVYIIEASRLSQLVNEVFPAPTISGGAVNYAANLRFGGLDSLVAKKLTWEPLVGDKPVDPFGADSGAPSDTYEDYLKVTIDYGTVPYNTSRPDPSDPLTYLEISATASGTYLNVPIRGKLYWVENGDKEPVRDFDAPNTVVEIETEWTVRWTQIPWSFFNGTLINRLRSKLGKVNNSAMTVLMNAPAETILFSGFSIQQQYTWRDGYSAASPVVLECRFAEKGFTVKEGTETIQVTHNHLYRPGVGWRRLVIHRGGSVYDPIYDSTNLDQLFLP